MRRALLALVLLAVSLFPASVAWADEEENASQDEGFVYARFSDGSTMKLKLNQATYELTTPYGKLSIPAKDVRLIELAPRVADEVVKLVEEAVANLGSPQFEIREKATADLLKVGPAAYAILLRQKSDDTEVATRLAAILDKVREKLPEDQQEPREYDILHTNNSKIAGRLELKEVKAETVQFGEVSLRLADTRELRFGEIAEAIDLSKLEAAPPNLYQMTTQIGKTFTYKVTGNSAAGSLWGTDVYTLDSALAAAAVHSGVLKHGQTGAVRIKIIESPASFSGSTKNGISSYDYGTYPAAYRIIKLK